MAWLSLVSFLNIEYIGLVLFTIVCAFLVYKCIKWTFEKATSKRLSKPGNVTRYLGRCEALLDVFSVERGGTMNMCLTVCLTSKNSLSHHHVRDALVLLAKRQPMLRATITTTENGDKYFQIKETKEVITR